MYEFKCRGTVKVKGKGEMMTYWLMGRKSGATSFGSNQQLTGEHAVLTSQASVSSNQSHGQSHGQSGSNKNLAGEFIVACGHIKPVT